MIQFCKNLFIYRELLRELVVSNIKARYKQSVLGVGWALLQPLALMVIAMVVFFQFAKVPSDGLPYPLFVYTALLPWTLHATALSSGITSLVSNVSLIRKIYFPRELFIVSAIMISLIDYLIASIVFIGMLIFYRITPGVWILSFPLLLFIHLLLITGIALGGAIINTAFRDVSKALPLVLQIWMLASPVMYPLSLVTEKYHVIYLLNPMVGIIDSYRKVILHNTAPDARSLLFSAGTSLILFAVGYRLFKAGEAMTADIV